MLKKLQQDNQSSDSDREINEYGKSNNGGGTQTNNSGLSTQELRYEFDKSAGELGKDQEAVLPTIPVVQIIGFLFTRTYIA